MRRFSSFETSAILEAWSRDKPRFDEVRLTMAELIERRLKELCQMMDELNVTSSAKLMAALDVVYAVACRQLDEAKKTANEWIYVKQVSVIALVALGFVCPVLFAIPLVLIYFIWPLIVIGILARFLINYKPFRHNTPPGWFVGLRRVPYN